MPKINNLKSVVNAGKSVVGQVSGALEEVAGAAGKGGFSVSAGPNGVSISGNFNELLRKKTQGNRIASPIKDLYEDKKQAGDLVFPADLDDEHYMIFQVKRRKRLKIDDKPEINTYRSFVLPIPSNLGFQQAAGYSDTELGMLGGLASGRISGAQLGDAVSSLSEGIKNRIAQSTNAYKNGDTTDAAVKDAATLAPAVATIAGGKLAGALGGLLAFGGTAGDVKSGLSVDTGLALNPHLAVVFQGVGFRVHQFSYKFMARNQQESDIIKNIINGFQYHMLPSYGAGNLAFKYPDEFEIKFAKGIDQYLYEIGTCVLESVNVNYNGEGIPLFFEQTGAPVSVTLDLSFKETQIHTKERLANRVEGPDLTSSEGSF
jgi:hypothetical protein